MYYVMERNGTIPGRWVDEYPFLKGVRFTRGSPITVPVPQPLEIRLKPLDPDADDHGPEIPEYLQGRIPLFRRDLVDAMVAAGVDNLELYDAVLVDPDDGARHDTHRAVNIIGTIAAADMAQSAATVHTGGPVIDVDFDSLVVDESRTGGALLFRLAESTNAILVHERLRDALLAAGFRNIAFYDPKDVAL